jgi:hypothetical protein
MTKINLILIGIICVIFGFKVCTELNGSNPVSPLEPPKLEDNTFMESEEGVRFRKALGTFIMVNGNKYRI